MLTSPKSIRSSNRSPDNRRFAALAALLLMACLIAGCQSAGRSEGVAARFHLEADTMAERTAATVVVTLPVSQSRIRIHDLPVFVESDLRSVDVVQVDLGQCLLFRLEPPARRSLYRLSGERQGRRLVFLFNGQPLGARLLEGVIDTGAIFIFLETEDARLAEIAASINRTLKPRNMRE